MKNTAKILIVDDSELIRMKLFCMLKEEFGESNLVFSETVEKAWEKLIKNTIDVVLLDIYLPGENGTDLISDMLANKRLKDIPVIVITGTKEDSFVKASFEKHVYAYLHKPIDKIRLFETIKECIN